MSGTELGHLLLALGAIVAPLLLAWLLLGWSGRRRDRDPGHRAGTRRRR